jgi:hypothetical protein
MKNKENEQENGQESKKVIENKCNTKDNYLLGILVFSTVMLIKNRKGNRKT